MTPAAPIKHDLTLAYAISLLVVGLTTGASVVGLVYRSGGLYGDEAEVVQVFRGGDAANLLVGLPLLLGSLWLARRGSLVGLLLWPGALFNLLYTYALYLVGAPFNGLFLAYVALVVLSAYATIGVVASIDGAAVQQRFAGAPARLVGGALVGVGLVATAGLTVPVITTLAGSTPVDPLLHARWIVDYTVGNPVLLIGGALLWQRTGLGYATAGGLLFVSGIGGVAFAVGGVLGALLTTTSLDAAVIAVHLVIAAISFALLAVFLRGAVPGRRVAGRRRLPA